MTRILDLSSSHKLAVLTKCNILLYSEKKMKNTGGETMTTLPLQYDPAELYMKEGLVGRNFRNVANLSSMVV